jgi:hypothetical protein
MEDTLDGIRGRSILVTTMIVVVALFSPIVVAGAPLADDFNNCLAPRELGTSDFLARSWERLQMVRLARFPEILLTTAVCRTLHFGIAIAVPLLLALAVAWQLAILLKELGASPPWPHIAGAVWLLQPLGTESALWPAALHIPLGLLSAIVAVRLYRSQRYSLAVATTALACFSVEQVILALPFIVWVASPRSARRRGTFLCSATVLVLLSILFVWHGTEPRLEASLGERISAAWSEPEFLVLFPAVGLGLHSIPMAIEWAFPWSVPFVVLIAAIAGAFGPRLVRAVQAGEAPGKRSSRIAAIAITVALLNIPVVLAVEHPGSPRVFAPTWLVLAGGLVVVLSNERWNRHRLLWVSGGVFAAGAVLSLLLSVSVRLESAAFVHYASDRLASQIPSGSDVAICDVRRTVVEPAPRGAFAIHEFVYDWAAQDAVRYYSGRSVTFDLSGELWERPCPSPSTVEARFDFDQLVREWQSNG